MDLEKVRKQQQLLVWVTSEENSYGVAEERWVDGITENSPLLLFIELIKHATTADSTFMMSLNTKISGSKLGS